MIPEDMTSFNNYMMAMTKDLIYYGRIIKQGSTQDNTECS